MYIGALLEVVIVVVGYDNAYVYRSSLTWASQERIPCGQSSWLDKCLASSTLFLDPYLYREGCRNFSCHTLSMP